jgi:hypothetical protein
MRSVLVGLMVLFCISFPAPTHAAPCQPAELFATDNTDPLFEAQADVTLALNGAAVTGSTRLDGVYWSNALRQIIRERAREFHLCGADGSSHTAAEALRRQFSQEAVLTFDYQHDGDAILIAVPGVDIARFGDALAADPTARDHIRGGSVTTTDHTLILVATDDDRDIARRLVAAAGGTWEAATIAYGRREFVQT